MPRHPLKRFLSFILQSCYLLVILLLPSDSLWLGWLLHCNDWVITKHQTIQLQNNVWGKQNSDDYQQCIAQNVQQPNQFRWRWHWSNDRLGVKAYPSLLYGYKPWVNYSTSPDLPKKLTDVNDIWVKFDVRSQTQGRVNLLLEAWLTDNPNPKPYDRTSEIAIHLMQQNWPGQGGEYVETISLQGHVFKVYLNHQMQVPNDPHTWSYLSFVKQGQPLYQARLNLRPFINYLLDKRFIIKSEYLSSIELGNEIDQGFGDTQIKSFSVHID